MAGKNGKAETVVNETGHEMKVAETPNFSTALKIDLTQVKSINDVASVEKVSPRGINKTNGEVFIILDIKMAKGMVENREVDNCFMQVINESTGDDEILVCSSELIIRQLQRVQRLNAFPVRGTFRQNMETGMRKRWELLDPSEAEATDTPF